MYLSHFRLTQKPFQISSDPAFLWMSEKHKEALAILKYGIIDNRGFLLLTGDVGTGKTTLINTLINSLEKDTIVATIPDPGLGKLDFYNYLANEFNFNKDFETKASFLVHFRHFLNDAYDQGKKILLVIDEAQRLDNDLLEEIRLLSNIEKQQTKLLNIFFIGQNDFNNRLLKLENRAIRQRITLNYHIDPLTENEIGKYIVHRLSVAGAKQPIFERSAIKHIFYYTKGFPRLINILCDHALLTAFVREKQKIGAEIIKECVKELRIVPATQDYSPTFSAHEHQPAETPQTPPEQTPPPVQPQEPPQPTPYIRVNSPSRKSGWGYVLITFCIILLLIIGGYSLHINGYTDFHEIRKLVDQLSPPSPPSSSPYKDKGPGEDDTDFSAPHAEQLEEETLTPAQSPAEATGEKDYDTVVQENIVSAPPSTEPEQPPKNIDNDGATEADPVILSKSPTPRDKPPEQSKNTPKTNFWNTLSPEDQRVYSMAVSGRIIPVSFIYNSNDLASSSYRNLAIITEIMNKLPDTRIQIRGYTDGMGTPHYNQNLSEFRANIVKSYILGNGIEKERIDSAGMGDANPVASNDTPQGRRANRRVELQIIFGSP